MTVKLIRKENAFNYIVDALIFGTIFGFFSFLFILIFTEYDIIDSFFRGLIFGIGCLFVIQIIRFFIKEMIIRGSLIKKLTNDHFKILHDYKIYLQNDLIFKGVYRGYSVNIYPRKEIVQKKTKLFFTINAYYNYPNSLQNDFSKWKSDEYNSKSYDEGSILFGSHAAILHPTDKYKPDFKKGIDFLIDKLNELELTPMDFNEWEKRYILPLEEKHKQERNQIFSIFKKSKKGKSTFH